MWPILLVLLGWPVEGSHKADPVAYRFAQLTDAPWMQGSCPLKPWEDFKEFKQVDLEFLVHKYQKNTC